MVLETEGQGHRTPVSWTCWRSGQDGAEPNLSKPAGAWGPEGVTNGCEEFVLNTAAPGGPLGSAEKGS